MFDLLVGPLMLAGGLSREPVDAHDGNVFDPQPAGNAVHGRWGRHWLRAVAAGGGALALAAGGAAGRRLRTGD
jgi:hypothetical protein